MAAKIELLPQARLDLAEAYDWYEQRGVGLGERFLSKVEDCLASIAAQPNLREVAHKSKLRVYRRALVERFPYAIFYSFDSDEVTVFAVLHTSRDSKKWRRRLP
jgi:plasmid stabilization system protein ParE